MMANGYQIDPHSNLMLETLFDLKESNGRIEQRLEDGKEFHHEVRETLKEHKRSLESHGRQLVVLRKQADQERRSSSSTVLEWIQVIKEIWPLLLMLTTIATAVGIHVPDWLKEPPTHSVSE
jgi:thiamine kinase-like enzyme